MHAFKEQVEEETWEMKERSRRREGKPGGSGQSKAGRRGFGEDADGSQLKTGCGIVEGDSQREGVALTVGLSTAISCEMDPGDGRA